jgi:hypothetical protein
MDLTEQQLDEIADKVLEKALVRLPEILGNLIQTHTSNFNLVKKFYTDHPELKSYRDVVAKTIEHIEGNNPDKNYEQILEKALPEIKKRIGVFDSVGFKKPQGELSLEIKDSAHGVL